MVSVSAWNCTKQGLWIILKNQVMTFGWRNSSSLFQMYLCFEHHKQSTNVVPLYNPEKEDITMVDISKTQQLTPEQSRLMNSPRGRGKNWLIWRVNCPFKDLSLKCKGLGWISTLAGLGWGHQCRLHFVGIHGHLSLAYTHISMQTEGRPGVWCTAALWEIWRQTEELAVNKRKCYQCGQERAPVLIPHSRKESF